MPAEEVMMTKLKLGVVLDDRPVKLTVELSAATHRDLIRYGQVLAEETSQKPVETSKLIEPMLVRFMATDRAFVRLKKPATKSKGAQ
jgi:hypothetical protein